MSRCRHTSIWFGQIVTVVIFGISNMFGLDFWSTLQFDVASIQVVCFFRCRFVRDLGIGRVVLTAKSSTSALTR